MTQYLESANFPFTVHSDVPSFAVRKHSYQRQIPEGEGWSGSSFQVTVITRGVKAGTQVGI